jgi:hypothetical protein
MATKTRIVAFLVVRSYPLLSILAGAAVNAVGKLPHCVDDSLN